MTRTIGTWRNAYRIAVAEQDRRIRSAVMTMGYSERRGQLIPRHLLDQAVRAATTRRLLVIRASRRGIQL